MPRAIYETSGRAKEYAPYALELYRACLHACEYCYNVTKVYPDGRVGKKERDKFFVPGEPIPKILWQLDRSAPKFAEKFKYLDEKHRPRVLMSFGSDPYQATERQYQVTRNAIKILIWNGIPWQTLTKNPALAVTRDMDLFKDPKVPGHLGCTMLFSADNDDLRAKWEPNAPPVADRQVALKAAHEAGIYTWVSVEPTIDPAEALKLIHECRDFVDLWKVGKLNYLPEAAKVDWYVYLRDVTRLLDSIGKPYIIKHDLKQYGGTNV